MNPPSELPPRKYVPARELFAGMGVPEEVLAEQERMDNLFAAHFFKPGRAMPRLVDSSDWDDEEI